MIIQPGHPPDEWLHFDYVRHLFLHRALPVYGETRYIFNPELLQAHAMLPPLYYLLGVPLLALAGDQPVEVQMVAVRMLSVIISTGTVAIAYALGRVLVPTRPRFALVFAALVGFNPMFTYMSAAINSDNLVNLIAAALLLMLVYGLRQAQHHWQDYPHATLWSPTRRWMIGMGALMGMGLLTKPTIALAILGCGVMLVWMAWQSPGLPQRLRLLLVMGGWIGGVALVISGWSFARNWYLYGDPVGVSLVGSQAGSYVPRPYAAIGSFGEMLLATREFDPLLPMLFQSFWGYFDHLQLLMPSRLFIILAILTVGGVGGTLLWLVRHWQRGSGERWQRASVVAGAVFIVLTVGAVLYACYRVDYQPQGRYLYTALLPLMLIIIVGWGQLAGMLKVSSLVAPLLLATIVVVNIAALVTTVAPGHHYRAVREQAGQGQHPVPLAHPPLAASPPTIAFGPFAAQYPFVPNSANVTQLDMVLDMSPGVYGPLIWRIADGQHHEVAHGVAEQVPRKLSRYTLVMPPDLRFNAGHPYTLTVHAPWANADKPLRAYAATPANIPAIGSDPVGSPHGLLALHIGYTDKPLEMGVYRLSRHLLTAPPQSAWGMGQLVLYGVVGLLMLALVWRGFSPAPLASSPTTLIAGVGVGVLAVLLIASDTPMALPHEQVQAETGQLLRLGERAGEDEDVVADLLLLADNPATVKYPPDDAVNKVSHIQPFTFVVSDTPDPVLFMHPTSAITYTLDVPANAHLETAITLNPLIWEHNEGGEESDGATFVVMVQDAGGRQHEHMRRFIDPRHNETDRRWHAVSLDLGAYAAQRVQLVLMVQPGPSGHALFDWAGWRQPVVR
jgi:4-amino-4-deoxy-L-arabinose transferase-like glycosyltransferase